MNNIIKIEQNEQGNLVVDSRLIAEELGIDPFPSELNMFEALGLARLLSLKGYVKEAWVIHNIIDDSTCNSLLGAYARLALVEGLAQDELCRGSEEGRVTNWFTANFKKYYPKAKLVSTYSIKRKRPDCILKIDDIDYPVECKLSFNKRSLCQLNIYKKLWKVEFAIAVAPRFTIDLPRNIHKIISP